jgi:hypothetical protein
VERLLKKQGLSNAVAPLQRAGVRTMDDLGLLEEWQVQNLDLPTVSRRKLQLEVDRFRLEVQAAKVCSTDDMDCCMSSVQTRMFVYSISNSDAMFFDSLALLPSTHTFVKIDSA